MKLSTFLLLAHTETLVITGCGGESNYKPEATQILLLASASETGGLITTLYRAPVTPEVNRIVSLWDFSLETNLPDSYRARIYLDGQELSTTSYNTPHAVNESGSFLQMLVVHKVDEVLYDTPFLIFLGKTPAQ